MRREPRAVAGKFYCFDMSNKSRGFKFEVQQPEVAWCSVIPPRRIPHAGF